MNKYLAVPSLLLSLVTGYALVPISPPINFEVNPSGQKVFKQEPKEGGLNLSEKSPMVSSVKPLEDIRKVSIYQNPKSKETYFALYEFELDDGTRCVHIENSGLNCNWNNQ